MIFSILKARKKIKKIIFVRFLVQMKTSKFAFQIYWPLKKAHFLSIMMRIEAFMVLAFHLLTYTSWMPCQHLSKGTHFLKLWGDIQGNYSTLLVFKNFLWSRLIFTNYLNTKGKLHKFKYSEWPEMFLTLEAKL